MTDVTHTFVDPDAVSLVAKLSGTPIRMKYLAIRALRCSVHKKGFELSIGARKLTERAVATHIASISACCDEFINTVLMRCKQVPEPAPDDWSIDKQRTKIPDMFDYVFSGRQLVRYFLQSQDVRNNFWNTKIAPLICEIHRKPLGGLDYNKEFTEATKDVPFWAKITACCDAFAIEALTALKLEVDKYLSEKITLNHRKL